jgi:hypothetical protein
MKSSNYDPPGHARFGGVQLVGKKKGCGKDNCKECPHGPFWYAYIHAAEAVAGVRTEVYLGKAWSEVDLREKVSVKMLPAACRVFLAAIATVIRSERIAYLESEAVRLHKAMNAEASRAQQEIARLRREEFGVKKELHGLREQG